MKKTKNILSLMLVSLLIGTSAFAVVVNPPTGEPPTIPCTQGGETPPLAGICCTGLEKNFAGVCDEPAVQDPSLVNCSSQADCPGGTGCFPQTAGDLFSVLVPSTADPVLRSQQNESLDIQLRSVDNFRLVGASCAHSRECVSYSCVAGICTDQKVCRYADEGEATGPGVNCGPNMVKNGAGICEFLPDDQFSIYPGLLPDVTITTQGQCQFTLDETTRQRSLIAMRSLRAMEWMFSTITLSPEEECLEILPVVREEIGHKFLQERKMILASFSRKLQQIELDYKQLIEAQKDSTATVSIHGESISEAALASRQTSGYDTLRLMKRRNQLFQSYETSMLEAVAAAHQKIVALDERIKEWKDTDPQTACEGSKYKTKKWPWKSWSVKHHLETKNHWAIHYEVTGNAYANSNIVKRENVAKVLALLTASSEQVAIAAFTQPKFYMIDPMLFGGMQHENYGEAKPLEDSGVFFNIFGKYRDLRRAYYIKGTGTGSFTRMHNFLKPQIKEFYKKLKTDAQMRNFVYEPELFTTEAKDCLDNPANPAKCAGFNEHLDSVLDEAFAHFLAFSYSTSDSYRDDYFRKAGTYRRRLLSKLDEDMVNISIYYSEVIAHRNEQNRCIDDVLGGLADSGVLDLTPTGTGLTEGGVPRTAAPGVAGFNRDNGNNALNNGRLNNLNRGNVNFDLLENSLSSLNSGTKMDNIGTSEGTSESAGVNNSAAAFFAVRADAMRKANAKAKAGGVKLEDKQKAVKDTIASMTGKNSSSLASTGAGAGMTSPSRASFGFGGNTGSAETSKDEIGEGANVPAGVAGNQGEINPNNPGANALGATDGYGNLSGAGSDGSNGGVYDPNAKDSMGLTDADKERMLSEYERNKKDYRPSDEDGLFNKVSKAYVRNLEKVLTKKKKLDP